MVKHKYYMNRKPHLNGSFSVHKEDCPFLAGKNRRIYLGMFESCRKALDTARVISLTSDGCYFCSREGSQAEAYIQQGGEVSSCPVCFFSEN